MKVSILTALMAFLLAAGIPFGTLAGPVLDTDSDTVPDSADNCDLVPNGAVGEPVGSLFAQCDTDQDGYGNACDADVNNDGGVGNPDYLPITNNFGQPTAAYPGADVNCDGGIGNPDYLPITNGFGTAPGSSGLSCAETIPCP